MGSLVKNADKADVIVNHAKQSALVFVYGKNDATKYCFVKNKTYNSVTMQKNVMRKNPL